MNADQDESRQSRAAVWTRHWASGAVHSCQGSYGDTYGGAVADFWSRALAPLVAGDRVLDLATGSGALPRLIVNARPSMALEIDAIDLATAPPAWADLQSHGHPARIRFIGGQGAEVLPFGDASFDLVVSQYGIEYADLNLALPEVVRVLVPGGRVALVMHHPESRPVKLAEVELSHIDWLLSPDGLLGATAAMLSPLSRASTPEGRAALARDPSADHTRERFNSAQDTLRMRGQVADGADLLFEVQNAVNPILATALQQGEAAARHSCEALARALQDSRLRLLELRSHTMTPSRLETLCDTLRTALGGVQVQTLHEGSHLMAWAVTAPI